MKRLALAVVLLAAGCGARTNDSPPERPYLPRALAESLARQADGIAAALASGEGCVAQTRAAALQQSVIVAVNEHRVPPRFLEPLASGVNDLAGRITCAPPSQPAQEKPKHEKRERHHHREHKDKGGD